MRFSAIRILLMLLCACMSTQYALAQNPKDEGRGSSPFDKLVDVGGGRRLHINCSGMNVTGGPTVVLEAGAGNASTAWNQVQPEVAKFARVCAYDRAGLGGSDPVPKPRTVVALTEDLRALLANAKVSRPHVLVGHSLGGILVRLYASYYPAEVVAMVLVNTFQLQVITTSAGYEPWQITHPSLGTFPHLGEKYTNSMPNQRLLRTRISRRLTTQLSAAEAQRYTSCFCPS